MFLLITSFLAGVLTVFAPCVLILLPVIVGSSLITDKDKKVDRLKPYVISVSLGVSVLLFTLLLKASTILIDVDPLVWKTVSGGIVVILGLSLLFPLVWAKLSARAGIEGSSNALLAKASKRSGLIGYVLTGAALGPVFAACSPIYALILATVLPVNLVLGLVYMTVYAAGLTVTLLAIALVGRRLTKKVNWTAKPDGWFRRSLAILLILVGVAVITGIDKNVQTWFLINVPINSTKLEEKLLPSNESGSTTSKAIFNVDQPYAAPEISGIADWINSDPQTIAGLKGKVVLIDFWTYSCINCIRTQPYLNKWYDSYEKDGLVIIGVHAPEFAFERLPENVRKAAKDENIKYSIALDNDFTTWKAYKNQFWPAKYLIDKDGQVRFTHFGEGAYAETEHAIQELLRETGKSVTIKIDQEKAAGSSSRSQTPETYLGFSRAKRFADADQFIASKPVNYQLSNNLAEHQWSLGGKWQIDSESSQTMSNNTKLTINFSAREVYLVMSGPQGALVDVSVDGLSSPGGADVNGQGKVSLDGARLYRIVQAISYQKNKQLTLTFPAGVTVNAFTFGG